MSSRDLLVASIVGVTVGTLVGYIAARRKGEPQENSTAKVNLPPRTIADIEALGIDRMRPYVRIYYSYYAGDGITKSHAERSFSSILLRTRILRDVSVIDTSTSLFSKTVSTPVMIAPTGFHRLADQDGEAAVARAAAVTGTAYVYNYLYSTVGIEEVAAAGKGAVLLGSIYITKDRNFVLFALRQMERLGFTSVVVTCDHPHDRVKNHTVPVFQAYNDIAFLNTVMVFPNARNYMASIGNPQGDQDIPLILDHTVTWDDIEWLVSQTALPVIAKGIINVDDAERALRAGVKGIIVSNHGGRQMDSLPSSISVLPDIVSAVGSRLHVLVDSGFRTGTHVLKALALGAKGVLVGRPVLWGLAYDGQAGVQQVLNIFREELEYDMKSTGCRSLADVTADVLYSK